MLPGVVFVHEISIIKLNKADKPYQILLLKDEKSVHIFKIQLDKNVILNDEVTTFESEDEMELLLKKKLEIKGTLPNEIKSWCSKHEIFKKPDGPKQPTEDIDTNL
jgi:hypothetical protein